MASTKALDVAAGTPAPHGEPRSARRWPGSRRGCGGREWDRLGRSRVFRCRGGWAQVGPAPGVHPPLHRSHGVGGCWSSLGMLVLAGGQAGGLQIPVPGDLGDGRSVCWGLSQHPWVQGWVGGVRQGLSVPFAGHLGEVTSDIFCLPVSPLLGPHPWVPTASAWLTLHPITPCPSWHCTPQPYPQMRLCPITLSPPALHPMTPCPLRHCTLQPCASGLCTPQQPALHPVPGLPCRSLQAQPGHRCHADPCPHPASSHQDPGGSPRPRAPRKQLPGEAGLCWAWPGFAWA